MTDTMKASKINIAP